MAAVDSASGTVTVDGLLAGLPGLRFDSTASQTTLAEAAEQILSTRGADEKLSRISRSALRHSGEITHESAITEAKTTPKEPMTAEKADSSSPAADFAGPTHILINSRAYSIINQSPESQGFGLMIEDGRVRVAEDSRSQINVLSTESTYDQLHAGCRLYRNDGTEALLIRVEG
jgi:hypothetical protein